MARVKEIKVFTPTNHIVAEDIHYRSGEGGWYVKQGERLYCGHCGKQMCVITADMQIPEFSIYTFFARTSESETRMVYSGLVHTCGNVIFKSFNLWPVITLRAYISSQQNARRQKEFELSEGKDLNL